MEKELGEGNKKPEILEKLAQYELTLLDWVEAHKGYREYVAIAGKCWPAFQTQFGFVPCCSHEHDRTVKMLCQQGFCNFRAEVAQIYAQRVAACLLDILQSLYHMDLALYNTEERLW